MSASPFGFGSGPRISPDELTALIQRMQAAQTDPRADMPAPDAAPVSFLTEPKASDGGFFIPPGVRATAPVGDPSGLHPGEALPGPVAQAIPPAMPPQAVQAPVATPPSMIGAQAPTFGFGALPVPAEAAPQRVAQAPTTTEADEPALRQVPLPPRRPLSFGPLPQPSPAATTQADMPVAGAVPASGQMLAKDDAGFDLSGGLRRFSDAGGGDLLTSLGIGLMSTRGLGAGLAAGLQNDQQQQSKRAATGLANAEMELKRQKLAREFQGQNATANIIASKLGIPADQAAGLAGNAGFVGEFFKSNYGTPAGWVKGPDGRLAPIPGSENDPATIEAKAKAAAAGAAAGKPEDTTADQKNYEQAKKDGYTKSFIDYQLEKANASRAQTTVNATVNPILKGLSEQFATGAEGARASADVVRAVQNARSQIEAPGGIIAGKFADNNLALQKIGAAFGVTDPQAIINTETFRTQIKPIVLETVKGLGAGSGVSNADRDFALQAVGGDINLDPGTIKRVLDVTERAARAKVERHNALSDQMLETQPELKQVAPMLRITLPEATPAPAAQPGGARRLRYDPGSGEFR